MDEKITCGASVSLLANNLTIHRNKGHVLLSYVHKSDVFVTISDSILSALQDFGGSMSVYPRILLIGSNLK